MSHIEPRIDHDRAGTKWRMLKFPMPQPHDKPDQLKLLPGQEAYNTDCRKDPFATILKY